jgi:hypothetical protein
MPDIRTGLMCKKCRDYPKLEMRLAKRQLWGLAVRILAREGSMAGEDMLAVLMRLEDPAVLDRLDPGPPSGLTTDLVFVLLGMR